MFVLYACLNVCAYVFSCKFTCVFGVRGGPAVSVLDCHSRGSGFKSQGSRNVDQDFCSRTQFSCDEYTDRIHCQWEHATARERTDHPPSYVEVKKMKLLTLHTHGCGCPKASLRKCSSSSSSSLFFFFFFLLLLLLIFFFLLLLPLFLPTCVCMAVCMFVCVHVCTYIVYICMHLYIYVDMYACTSYIIYLRVYRCEYN